MDNSQTGSKMSSTGGKAPAYKLKRLKPKSKASDHPRVNSNPNCPNGSKE